MSSSVNNEPPPKRSRYSKSSAGQRSRAQTNADSETSDIDDERPSQSDQATMCAVPPSLTDEVDEQVGRLSQVSIDDEANMPEQCEETLTPLERECAKRACLDGTYFALHKEGSDVAGTILAECKFCVPLNILRITLRATSGLTTHLRNVHPTQFVAYKEYTKTKRASSTIDRVKWSCTFDQELFEENVTNYVLDTMASLSTVENKSFRKIIDDLNIKKTGFSVKHMTRYTVLKRINQQVEQQLNDIRGVMGKTQYVCTTADAWSGKKRRFLGVTLHWIDESTMDRKSAAIACKRFPGTHSHEAIARQLNEIHGSFNLGNDKLVATITDNGSNFVKAFKEYGIDESDQILLALPTNNIQGSDIIQDVAEEEMVLEDAAEIDADFGVHCERQLPQHLRCASHTLNLIATTDTTKAIARSDALAEAHAKALGKCNSLWKNLRSPKNSETLKDYLGIALKRPIVTRWNSFYEAVQQIVACKEKLLRRSGGSESDVVIRDPFISADFRYLEEYLRCTRDLAKAIDLLQGETYCHYGYLLPTLVQLRRQMLLLEDCGDIEVCQPIVQATIRGIETRFREIFQVSGIGKAAAIAAVTHPKFKIRWLRCLSENDQRRVYNSVVDAVAAQSGTVTPENPLSNQTTDDWDFGSAPTIFENLQPSVNRATSEVEVTRYLEDPNLELTMLRGYPTLKKVFLKYNTPLPSSAPVERLFSYATMADLPKYNRLTDAHFELRVLAKVNGAKPYF